MVYFGRGHSETSVIRGMMFLRDKSFEYIEHKYL